MNFEKILEIFKEQFEVDKDLEVASFRRGYQIFTWSSSREVYIPVYEPIQDLHELFEALLDLTREFYESKFEDPETEEIDEEHQAMIDKTIAELTEKYNKLV